MLTPDMKLIAAARANNLLLAMVAIGEGANPGAAEDDGTSAAMWFAHRRNGAAVLALAQLDPTILEARNEIGQNVITQFARCNNYAMLIACEKLCPGVITMTDEHGYNAAMYLARAFNVEGLMAILPLAPQMLTQRSTEGECVMSWLARWGQHDPIRAVTAAYPLAKKLSPYKAILDGMGKSYDNTALTILMGLFLELGYQTPVNFEKLLDEYDIDAGEVMHLALKNT